MVRPCLAGIQSIPRDQRPYHRSVEAELGASSRKLEPGKADERDLLDDFLCSVCGILSGGLREGP